MTIGERDLASATYAERPNIGLQKHAQRIVERLVSGNGILACDVDGVLLRGDIGDDMLTDPSLVQSLPLLDRQLKLRLVTARGEDVLPIMRKLVGWPLDLYGPHIIEEGHAWLMDGKVHPLVSDKNIAFFQSLHTDLHDNDLCVSWEEVQLKPNAFCWGPPRYQGKCSGSVWFRHQDFGYMQPKLQKMITDLANEASVDVDFHSNSRPDEDLSWLRIRSGVDKGYRLHTLGLPDVYVCDGPNDRQVVSAMKPDILLPYMRNTGGIIIAVQSLDEKTEDMKWVHENADIRIENYEELGNLFSLITQQLPFARKRTFHPRLF